MTSQTSLSRYITLLYDQLEQKLRAYHLVLDKLEQKGSSLSLDHLQQYSGMEQELISSINELSKCLTSLASHEDFAYSSQDPRVQELRDRVADLTASGQKRLVAVSDSLRQAVTRFKTRSGENKKVQRRRSAYGDLPAPVQIDVSA